MTQNGNYTAAEGADFANEMNQKVVNGIHQNGMDVIQNGVIGVKHDETDF